MKGKSITAMTEYMSRRKLLINGFAHISLIKYYRLPGGIPGLMVIADKNELINLSACDPDFEALENAALAAFLTSPGTAADAFTADLLKSRSKRELPRCMTGFEGLCGSLLPEITYEKNFTLAMKNFIFYFLGELMDGLASEIKFDGNIAGYRSRCAVSCTADGRERMIPFETKRTDRGAVFRFSNVLEAAHTAEISLDCCNTAIRVNVTGRFSRELRREYVYDPFAGNMRLRIFDRGELVCDKTEGMTFSEAGEMSRGGISLDDISRICCTDVKDFRIYPLPWGGVCLSCLSGDTDNTRDLITADTSDGAMVVRHFYRQYAPSGSPDIPDNMTVDSADCVHEIFPLKSGRKVQSCFLPTGEFSRGIYKENYMKKYFNRTLG